jgi:5-methyltetrahydrofolate--homocysteine methyltransferase
VDLFVIETMMDIQEARAALIAVREVCDLFCMVTMTYEKHGRTLNGTDPLSALVTLQSLGADAVGCNCSAGPEGMLGLIAAMKPQATVPLVAKPNAGLPTLVGEDTVFSMDPAGFAGFAGPLAVAGVNLMGGCCGTTPVHIRALRDALTTVKPVAPARRVAPAASSARNAVVLREGGPLVIVGGRLNTAGNQTLCDSLATEDFGAVRQTVRAQEKEGAQLLLLKVGAVGIDETTMTRKILETLAPTTRSSFLLAAEKVGTLGQALRLYPGRLMVGVAGPHAEALLPVAAQYGAIPVISVSAACGKGVIRRAAAEAREYGFSKEQIVIDCTPGEDNPEALREAIGMVSWCNRNLRCRTLLDLTEVGKGQPEQPWIQAYLLAAAQAMGLTVAVIDPAVVELMRIRAAGDGFRTEGKLLGLARSE